MAADEKQISSGRSKCGGSHGDNYDQADDDEDKSDQEDEYDTTARRRELAANDVVL